MRNLLALVGAALVAFLAVGYYCDWYKIESTKDKDGHNQFGIRVDPTEIKEDLTKARQQFNNTVENKSQGTTPVQPVQPAQAVQPASQPTSFGPIVITPASGTKDQPKGSWIIAPW